MLAFSALLVGYFHVSSWAVEPPSDVILPYANPLVDSIAFVVLLALVASAVAGAAVMYLRWRRSTE